MKKRHLLLVAASALGLLALTWAGGPAGSSFRLGPLEWSFALADEALPVDSSPLVTFEDPREPVS